MGNFSGKRHETAHVSLLFHALGPVVGNMFRQGLFFGLLQGLPQFVTHGMHDVVIDLSIE